MKLDFVIALFVVGLFVLSGCSKVETAGSEDAQTETAAADIVEPDGGEAKIDLVGKWNLHVEQTISANSALMSGGRVNASALREAIRTMVLEFELHDDKTFECYEEAGGQISDYTGTWELKGDKVQLLQEFHNGEKVKDEISGTVKENRMDMVHNQEGISLKLVLLR